MEHIGRIIPIEELIKRKSLFLLGPRQTGKSSLLKRKFKAERNINLLYNDVSLRYQADPGLLRRELESETKQLIIIDEIQRNPELLNEAHYLIEECGHRFIFTGSSARKLKKVGSNLLGGRATQIKMHPFTWKELGSKFKLDKALSYGLLPPIYFSENPKEDLKDYVGLYLREEIMNEGLTRNLPAFARFLETAATMNGKMINYTKIANDAQISPSTTYEYFKVLEDTLIGSELLSYNRTIKRKAIATSKFYFFDLGVVRALLEKNEINKSDSDYGEYFEAFIYQELSAYSSYNRLSPLKYWRSTSNFEVDFILDDKIAIEVKSSKRIVEQDLKGLRALAEENLQKRLYMVSFDKIEQKWHNVHCLHWEVFLKKLWDGDI